MHVHCKTCLKFKHAFSVMHFRCVKYAWDCLHFVDEKWFHVCIEYFFYVKTRIVPKYSKMQQNIISICYLLVHFNDFYCEDDSNTKNGIFYYYCHCIKNPTENPKGHY